MSPSNQNPPVSGPIERATFQRFYDGLFRSPAGAPDEDYKAICKIWREYSEACSVFLWLCQNTPKGRVWYLVAFDDKPGLNLELPKALWHNAWEVRSIVEYCALVKEAWFIQDAIGWEAQEPEGATPGLGLFRMHNRGYFEKIGCKSLIAIPLIRAKENGTALPSEDGSIPQEVVGAICLHYRESFARLIGEQVERNMVAEFAPVSATDIPRTPEKLTLELFGRFTAQELLRSREALQKRTLLKLNQLAGEWLVASSRQPDMARKMYLKALGGLINEVFRVDSLSIFYRERPNYDAVSLLFSTGIIEVGKDSALISPDLWSSVKYSIGINQTGKCFGTGEIIPLPDGLGNVDKGIYPRTYEVAVKSDGTWAPKEWSDPALILPIPLPTSETPRPGEGKALGVIRLASHRWSAVMHMNRAFDPVEIETLEFLAQQIGPVLETMARNIEVEIAIQEQRHELRNSVRMINELIDEMTEDLHNAAPEATKAVRAYDLWDLKYSGLLARAQVQRLYRDETENRELNTAATEIHGQIVKRVCDIVGRRTAEQKNIRVNLTISAKISQGAIQKMYVDPWYIEQAFLNILMNAVKYGNGGSVIDVDLAEYGDRTVVSVKNQGVGIEESDRDKIFESGYRSAKAAARATGAGLGLPISRVIMRKHGGDVTLERLASPTIFQITFPASLRNALPGT